MNSRIEATLMIAAGALLAAGAQFGPTLGEKAISAMQQTSPQTSAQATEARPGLATWRADFSEETNGYRLALCQDAPQPVRTNNATINTKSDDGGFTVKITDGTLVKVETEGAYRVEEEGDLIRILDGDGDVAFETSKSNPSIGNSGLDLRFFGSGFHQGVAPAAPMELAVLGIGSSELDAAMAAQLGIDRGVVIEFVEPGSGADAGGLQQFDVLVSIDGEQVDGRSLTSMIRSHKPGDSVEVGVVRKGERLSFDVELGAAPGIAPAINRFNIAPDGFTDVERMQRSLEAQLRELESLMQGHQQNIFPNAEPRQILTPRLPEAAPEPDAGQHPDAVDASEMAPKTRTTRIPA